MKTVAIAALLLPLAAFACDEADDIKADDCQLEAAEDEACTGDEGIDDCECVRLMRACELKYDCLSEERVKICLATNPKCTEEQCNEGERSSLAALAAVAAVAAVLL